MDLFLTYTLFVPCSNPRSKTARIHKHSPIVQRPVTDRLTLSTIRL